MHIHPNRLWKSDRPRFTVVLDAELIYDDAVHARYLMAERFDPSDALTIPTRDARRDPRITPRWPCKSITTLSWLVMSDSPEDGLRPLRLETVGHPEHDEAGIVSAFFNDMERLGSVTLVTWGGFYTDIPQLLLAAMKAGLRLPACLAGLSSPWRRDPALHLDLAAEVTGGANPVHLAEVAAKLGIPTKLTCQPAKVSQLMVQGKWSSVRAVSEGDALTTALILMRHRHLSGAGTSTLETSQRLTRFITEHCSHRPYCAEWASFGQNQMAAAFAREAASAAHLAPHLLD